MARWFRWLSRTALVRSIGLAGLFLSVLWPHTDAAAQPCDDEELSEVAVELLLGLGNSERAPSAETITTALRDIGSSLPFARVRVSDPEDDIAPWVNRQMARSRGYGVCGEAVGARRVIVFARRMGRLIERPGPEGNLLRIELRPSLRAPYLVLVDPRGVPQAVSVPRGRVLPLRSDISRVQLMATGPRGPEPIAVWGDGALPTLPEGRDPAERLSRLRAQSQVGDLRANRLLSRAATTHARAVCQARQARHVFDSWPAERMRRLGLRARHLGETVARARTVDEAFEALAQSPSHRMALLDRRFTDVGFGVIRRDGEACVVVFLAAWPQAVGGL